MIERILEPEAMDTADEAREYDLMDHVAVNAAFVSDMIAAAARVPGLRWREDFIVDIGTGTARIPIELCRRERSCRVIAVDLAHEMLAVGARNVIEAELQSRIALVRARAGALPLGDASARMLVSNSLMHHLPDPAAALREACRVVAPGGIVFMRDLFRPPSRAELDRLVGVHAGTATAGQRQLFADSLHAALTVEEVRAMADGMAFATSSVEATSDRHWTLVATRA